MNHKQRQLQQIKLFESLSGEALQTLANIATPLTYDNGQLIMLESEQDVPVFFIVAGHVRVFKSNVDGREQVLNIMKPGEAFNIPTAFSNEHAAPANVSALGAVTLLAVPAADFRRVASQTPEIALVIFQDLSDKLRHFVGLTHNLSLMNVRGRLARFLLKQIHSENSMPIKWTQEEIAAQIGSVRPVVSRTLSAFVKDGMIRLERQQIIIVDPDALAFEAEL